MTIRSGLISVGVALAVLLAGFWLFVLPERSYACAPTYIGPPLEELERANSVFRGKVISATWLDRESLSEALIYEFMATTATIYEFMVTTVWKGPLAEKRTIASISDCGRQFSQGEEYLVYSGDGYSDWFSTRTRPISEADEDLAELGEGHMPISGTVLPPLEEDTEPVKGLTPTPAIPVPTPEAGTEPVKGLTPAPTPEAGGGCGISPHRVDLSIAGLVIGIVWLGLRRRRSETP